MAWRDGLRKGSFRGAPFEFDATDGEYGRRVAEHVYPLRDGAEGEDLGEESGKQRLSVFIVDTDFGNYVAKRTALIDAIRAPGTGKLVHPILGEMTVWLRGRVNESVQEMGVCRFDLEFWEESASSATQGAAIDTGAAADTSAASAFSATNSSFASRFSVSGLESSVGGFFTDNFGGVISVIKQASGYIKMASSLAGQVAGFVDGQAINALGFLGSMTSLSGGGGFAALINLPTTLGLLYSPLVSSMSFIWKSSNTPGVIGGSSTSLSLPAPVGLKVTGLIGAMSFVGQSNTPITITGWAVARQIGPQSVSARGQTPQGFTQATMDSVRKAQLAIADGLATTDLTVLRSAGALPASSLGAPLPLFAPVAGISDATARMVAAATTPAATITVGNTGGSSGVALPFTGAGTSAGRAQILQSYAISLGVTPSQLQQAINQVELMDLGRRTALIQAAQAAVASSFSCSADAFAARDDLASRFDAECLVTTDDSVRAALQDLRISMYRDITARAATLPRLVTITLPQSIPAVVLAHRLYDDPSYADDICARNGVDNALFLPAGVPLEVLSG